MEAGLTADRVPGRTDAPGRAALVLVGFMGAGKSSAARLVGRELGVRPLDSDRALERVLGEPIESFFDREGEAAFRAREEETALALLARPDARVVALGGGTLQSERVRAALCRHTVVHLEVDGDAAWRRASGRGRPLARERGRFDELHASRAALYEEVADATVPSADREVVRRALPALEALRADGSAGLRMVWASTGSGEYPVFLEGGLLGRGFFFPAGGRRFAVTDENVIHHHRIDAAAEVVIPPGESEKSMARAEAVLRELARSGLTRDDLVAAVGGGVVGDLAGFCAATYQRGVRHVQVPTTLVAQVDSAYGGKTGVDLPEGKNYVGAFHQPTAVMVDPTTLATLPPEEQAAGFAEVLKTALIAGGPLWEGVRAAGPIDDALIRGCVRTKLAIVADDERDEGRRQVLNLGHTVGHAIEAATGYRRFRHGEAVAIGLACALRLSGREELRSEVVELLRGRGLPVTAPGLDASLVIDHLQRDKKRSAGVVPFVLVEAPGAVTHGHHVADADLRAALAEAGVA